MAAVEVNGAVLGFTRVDLHLGQPGLQRGLVAPGVTRQLAPDHQHALPRGLVTGHGQHMAIDQPEPELSVFGLFNAGRMPAGLLVFGQVRVRHTLQVDGIAARPVQQRHMQADQPVEGFHQVHGFFNLHVGAGLLDLQFVGGGVGKFLDVEQAGAVGGFEVEPVAQHVVAL